MSSLLLENLMSPVVLAFVLGLSARLWGSDLKVPDPVFQMLSLYLLLAIGLKGGVELKTAQFSELWQPMLATLVLGCSIPIIVFHAARRCLGATTSDAASLAAHYGSVSVVTFVAASTFVGNAGYAVAGVLTALVVVMEIPGIVVGLSLGKASGGSALRTVVSELLRCKGVILLVGGLCVGYFASTSGMASVKPFFVTVFPGVLVLFLLELGIVCGQRLKELLQFGWRLPVFGVLTSAIFGCIGVTLGQFAGMDAGSAAVFGAMAGSASYIAAPAAVGHAMPEANPSISLGLALGISFPFNLAIGIPMALGVSKWLAQL